MTNPLKQILSYFPQSLPVGMSQFDQFATDIIELAGPYADKDSMRWAIASQIMHSSTSKLSKQYFVRSLRKAAANQVASQVFNDIKTKQAEEAKAAQQLAADTANKAVSDAQILPDQKV